MFFFLVLSVDWASQVKNSRKEGHGRLALSLLLLIAIYDVLYVIREGPGAKKEPLVPYLFLEPCSAQTMNRFDPGSSTLNCEQSL